MSIEPERHVASVSVVVCTRDRPDDLRRCLPSVLAARPPGCRAFIVDQSQGQETAVVVKEAAAGADDVEYVVSGRTGASVARNQGAALADTELLVFTDDDCDVDKEWVRSWCEIFDADPTLGIGFGLVTTPPFDVSAGFIPAFDPGPGTQTWGRELFTQGPARVGIGANMAVRREAFVAVGGFDEDLGPGAKFRMAEETDLAFRMARAGYRICHTQRCSVVHYGYREGSDASRLIRGAYIGVGAMYTKHARCGDVRAMALLALEVARLMIRISRNVLTGKRPSEFNRLRGLISGIGMSLATPIDRRLRVFNVQGSKVP